MRKTKKRNTKRNNKRRIKKNNKRRTKRNNKRRSKRNNKRRSYKGGRGMLKKFKRGDEKEEFKVSGYNLSFKPEEYYDTNNVDKIVSNFKIKNKINDLYGKFNNNITIDNFNSKREAKEFLKEKNIKQIQTLKQKLMVAQEVFEDNYNVYFLINSSIREEEEQWKRKKNENEKKIESILNSQSPIIENDANSLMKVYNIIFNVNNNFLNNDENDEIKKRYEEIIKKINEKTNLQYINYISDSSNDESILKQREFIQNFLIHHIQSNILFNNNNSNKINLINIMKYIYNYERLLLLNTMDLLLSSIDLSEIE